MAPLLFLLLEGGNWGAGVRDFSRRQEVAKIKRSAIGNNKSVRAKWPRVVVLQGLQWSLGEGVGDCLPPGLLDGTGFWTIRMIPEVKED